MEGNIRFGAPLFENLLRVHPIGCSITGCALMDDEPPATALACGISAYRLVSHQVVQDLFHPHLDFRRATTALKFCPLPR